ncbi:UNVERIFIED_CONTAM: hypothetical protein FKN15_069950, partial [Acipenser sinensis]
SLTFFFSPACFSVLGFGVDPALQINFFSEFQLGKSFDGVSQVHGFHNGSKAFLFQDTSRSIKASPDVAERVLQKLRNKQEFTILVTLKQERLNSGVILSIHHADQRFLELESSGHRNEIRLHYRTKSQQAHTEVFPYILADNQWHKVSIAVSASHVILHVDCSRFLELESSGHRNEIRLHYRTKSQQAHTEVFPYILADNQWHKVSIAVSASHVILHVDCSSVVNQVIKSYSYTSPPFKGYDFCADGHRCMDHSECMNLEAGACCICKDGFRALREDNAYCEDIDECAEGRHYCRENTMCVNTPGSFLCICNTGYIRIDDYSCTDIDECAEGRHYCRENTMCVNTAGSFLCICNTGYIRIDDYSCTEHDECMTGQHICDENALCFNTVGGHNCMCKPGYTGNGTFCKDIDECATGRHGCASDTVCFNLDGGYDCKCPHGKNCTGDCVHESKIKHNGQIWVLENDRCTVCSCQSGLVMCRRMVCDCENPTVDLFCCPECDPRLSSQCLHQSGQMVYSSGDTWVQNCQQCQCLQGEVDCWPLFCPKIECEFTVIPEGECCPRCVSDPCQADTVRNDLTKTCTDEHNMVRFTGSSWIKHGTECTLCHCKNGHVCCLVDPMCL